MPTPLLFFFLGMYEDIIATFFFFFFFLIGKKKYIQKTTRCKIAPAKQKYINEKKQKRKNKKCINYKEEES